MPDDFPTKGPRPGPRDGPIRIFIVDDHPIVRRGLIEAIHEQADMTVCGESDGDADALARITAAQPDVAIVDLSLGLESGLELVRTLDASVPDLRVLILS